MMNRAASLLLLLTLPLLLLAGCDGAQEQDTSGVVTLEGRVLETGTNDPVTNAFVRLAPYDLLFETNEEGVFSSTVEIDSTMELSLTASKDGFGTDKTTVLALAGRTIAVPTLRLVRTTSEELQSGRASNLLLLSQSSNTIGVQESGSDEVASLTFMATDSLGRAVVLNNAIDVNFALGTRPNGGEFISPTTARTDNNGQVKVNLSSGTRAGVVQVVASAIVDGRPIRSQPVAITIHGGLPDAAHFTVSPAQVNFPGRVTYGLINPISVIVGDEYSNPVKPGTAVYFNTEYGVIEGSVQTNSQGRGSVNLISANPLPPLGIARIEATTADKNQAPVRGETAVIFSGFPSLSITPFVARLGETYSVVLADQNGNPLASGTKLTVNVEGTKVKGVGNTDITLGDSYFSGGLGYDNVVRGPGITEFTFSAVSSLKVDEEGTPAVEAITVRVTGPNGTLELVLPRGGEPMPIMEGMRTRVAGDRLIVEPER